MEVVSSLVEGVGHYYADKQAAATVKQTADAFMGMRKYTGPTVRNLYELDDSRRKYAHFANAGYNDIEYVKGYKLDRNLSDNQFKV